MRVVEGPPGTLDNFWNANPSCKIYIYIYIYICMHIVPPHVRTLFSKISVAAERRWLLRSGKSLKFKLHFVYIYIYTYIYKQTSPKYT